MSGASSNALATAMPTTFCATHTAIENSRNTSTGTPPARSSGTLAPMPMDVKKATLSSG